MGPHSIECGMFPPLALSTRTKYGRFNGAALYRVRNDSYSWHGDLHRLTASMGPHSIECGMLLRERPHQQHAVDKASMGPHSIECGMSHGVGERNPPQSPLQWGRTLSSAE